MMVVESGNDYPPCRSGRVVLLHRAGGGATLAFKTRTSGKNNTHNTNRSVISPLWKEPFLEAKRRRESP